MNCSKMIKLNIILKKLTQISWKVCGRFIAFVRNAKSFLIVILVCSVCRNQPSYQNFRVWELLNDKEILNEWRLVRIMNKYITAKINLKEYQTLENNYHSSSPFEKQLIFKLGQPISLLVFYYRWITVKLLKSLCTSFSTTRKFQRIISNKCFIKSRTYFLLGKFFNFCFENIYY